MRNLCILLALVGLGLGSNARAEVLIDYDDGQDNGVHDKEIRAGGFTGLSQYAYAPWKLLAKVGGVQILNSMACDVGSAENLVMANTRQMAIDTGHTIANGDKFNLSFYWRDALGWNSRASVELMLYYTDNDQIDGNTVGTILLNSGGRKEQGKWEMVSSANQSFADDKGAGKKLFARVYSRCGEKEYARLDNVFVEVVPAEAPQPEKAPDDGVAN